jgi:hypothetical protein
MIKVLLAGMLSVRRQFPHVDSDVRVTGRDDTLRAWSHMEDWAMLRGLPQPVRGNLDVYGNLIGDFKNETEDLIEANWPAIGRVARALHRNAVLGPVDLDAIIRPPKRRPL